MAVRHCVVNPRAGEALAGSAEIRRHDLRTGDVVPTGAPPEHGPVIGGWRRVRDDRALFWSAHEVLIISRESAVPVKAQIQWECDAAVILGRERLALVGRSEQGSGRLQVFDGLSTALRFAMRLPVRASWMDTFGDDGFAFGRADGVVGLGMVADDTRVFFDLEGHSGPVRHGAVVPGDRHLVTAGADLTVRVWSILDEPILQGSLSAVCQGHTDDITGLAVTPDGQCVATSSRDRTIRLWSIPDGRSLGVLSEHRDWVTHVAVNPAGTHLATCSEDRAVKLWNLDSRECVGTAYGVSRFLCLAMSDDTVCVGDAAGNLWMFQYGDDAPAGVQTKNAAS
jgi:hypothetical protein